MVKINMKCDKFFSMDNLNWHSTGDVMIALLCLIPVFIQEPDQIIVLQFGTHFGVIQRVSTAQKGGTESDSVERICADMISDGTEQGFSRVTGIETLTLSNVNTIICRPFERHIWLCLF